MWFWRGSALTTTGSTLQMIYQCQIALYFFFSFFFGEGRGYQHHHHHHYNYYYDHCFQQQQHFLSSSATATSSGATAAAAAVVVVVVDIRDVRITRTMRRAGGGWGRGWWGGGGGGLSVGLTTASSGLSCRCISLRRVAGLRVSFWQCRIEAAGTQSHVCEGPRRQANCPRTTVWTPTSTVGTVKDSGDGVGQADHLAKEDSPYRTGSMRTTSASKNSWTTRRKPSSSGTMTSPSLLSVTDSNTSKGRPRRHFAECRMSGGRRRPMKSKPIHCHKELKNVLQRHQGSLRPYQTAHHAAPVSWRLNLCLRRRAASTQGGGNTSVPCSTDPPLWTPLCSTRSHRSSWSPVSTFPQRSMKFRRRSNRPARENPLGWTGFLARSSSQTVQWPSKHPIHSSPASGKKRMFRNATVVCLFKNKTDCGNYRGISLLSIAGKILARVILNRLITNISEENMPEAPCGFRLNRSTSDRCGRSVSNRIWTSLLYSYTWRKPSTRSTERPFWWFCPSWGARPSSWTWFASSTTTWQDRYFQTEKHQSPSAYQTVSSKGVCWLPSSSAYYSPAC